MPFLCTELTRTANGPARNLEVALDDKRGEMYSAPPPPAYIAFSGTGTTLRSEAVPSSDSLVFTADSVAGAQSLVDEGRPTTTLQVRTYDGKKLRIK